MGCLDYTHAIPNTNLCWHLNTSCCNLSHMETVRGNGARLFRNHMFTFRKSLYHLFKLLPHPSRIGIRDANRSWEVAPNSTKNGHGICNLAGGHLRDAGFRPSTINQTLRVTTKTGFSAKRSLLLTWVTYGIVYHRVLQPLLVRFKRRWV